MPFIDELDTAEFPVPPASAFKEPSQPPPSPIVVDVAGRSDPGKVRPNNEDQFLISRFGRFLETLQTSLPSGAVPSRHEEGGFALLVADGIGGHAAGDVASKLAINTLVDLALAMPDWILRLDDDSLAAEFMRRTEEIFRNIHVVLTKRASADPSLSGFGTTLTTAMSIGRDLIVTSMGDSRAYVYRDNALQQLTRDHTIAQGLADRGLISQDEVSTHRMRNVLTKSLGAAPGDVRPDVRRTALEDGDCLLLCSDGLTDMISDREIAATLANGKSAGKTADDLIAQALEAGGKDNVTVIVARYRLPPLANAPERGR